MGVITKSAREIAAMRRAGKVVASVLEVLKREVRPGVRTRELDSIAAHEIWRLGGKPSFKGYRGFPASICVSVNDEIVHGIPGERVLREGDVVSLDVGAIVAGYQGDSAITVGVGEISIEASELIRATESALRAGIAAARDGARLGDISASIQKCAESGGYSVVREYTGHGIGREMHEDPLIPNFGAPNTGLLLRKGMTLALEPMLNIGTWQTKVAGDAWTVLTADGSLSAHFEHTIVINDGEAEVLTALEGVYA